MGIGTDSRRQAGAERVADGTEQWVLVGASWGRRHKAGRSGHRQEGSKWQREAGKAESMCSGVSL